MIPIVLLLKKERNIMMKGRKGKNNENKRKMNRNLKNV